MQLTLLVERNKFSYVHSLADMVKANGAKVHDYKRKAYDVLPATQRAFKGQSYFLIFFF